MKALFLLGFLLLNLITKAQTVENLRTEQDGDKVVIYYQIEGAKKDQTFTVTISCKTKSFGKFELLSISGDVGENIPGGKYEYKAVWDVLMDVNELTDAEFFVKATLTYDLTFDVKDKALKQHNWFAAYYGGIYTPFGVQVGYLKNWGGFLGCRVSLSNFDAVSFTMGVTKRMIKKDKFNMYSYLAAGYGGWAHYEDWRYGYPLNNGQDEGKELGLGFIGIIKRTVFSLGYAHIFVNSSPNDEYYVISQNNALTFSLGIRF